jgi:four helix bundle protein
VGSGRGASYHNQINGGITHTGFGRGEIKDFLQLLSTAKGSASEVQARLYLILETNHINEEPFRSLDALAQSTGNMIGA